MPSKNALNPFKKHSWLIINGTKPPDDRNWTVRRYCRTLHTGKAHPGFSISITAKFQTPARSPLGFHRKMPATPESRSLSCEAVERVAHPVTRRLGNDSPVDGGNCVSPLRQKIGRPYAGDQISCSRRRRRDPPTNRRPTAGKRMSLSASCRVGASVHDYPSSR